MTRPPYSLKATAAVSCVYAAGMLLCIGYLYLVPSIFDYWGPARKAFEDGDFASASEYYDRILELRPRAFYPHYFRGYTSGAQGDLEGALASFDAALEIKPHDSFTLAAKAIVLLRLSRFEEAVDVGTQFSSHDSSYFYVQYALAYHLLESGDLEQAEGMLRQAVAVDTTWALGHYSLGCVLNRSGRPRLAVEAYTRAKTLDPTITDVGYESAWLRIAAPPWPVSDDEEKTAQACWEE